MADALDLGVTAEGVETRQQLTMLKEMGCQRAQGFFSPGRYPGRKWIDSWSAAIGGRSTELVKLARCEAGRCCE